MVFQQSVWQEIFLSLDFQLFKTVKNFDIYLSVFMSHHPMNYDTYFQRYTIIHNL